MIYGILTLSKQFVSVEKLILILITIGN